MDLKGSNTDIGWKYAFHGIKHVLKQERNFRIHLFVFVFVIGAGIMFNLSRVEWMLILVVSASVFVVEMINTAIELLVDYLKPDIHPTAKAIKDVAAGAVLVSAIGAMLVGSIIFLPKVIPF